MMSKSALASRSALRSGKCTAPRMRRCEIRRMMPAVAIRFASSGSASRRATRSSSVSQNWASSVALSRPELGLDDVDDDLRALAQVVDRQLAGEVGEPAEQLEDPVGDVRGVAVEQVGDVGGQPGERADHVVELVHGAGEAAAGVVEQPLRERLERLLDVVDHRPALRLVGADAGDRREDVHDQRLV